MVNKVVLIMKSREDFSWKKMVNTLIYRYKLDNSNGVSILLCSPVLRKSILFGAVLHETDTRVLRSDRIFSHRFNSLLSMGGDGFVEAYRNIKKASEQ